MPVVDPKAFKLLGDIEVPFGSGIHLRPSRLTAPLGSLTNCRNFEVVDGTYEESQGLTLIGPTLSDGLREFWHANLDPSLVAATGSVDAGDYLYWYGEDGVTVAGTARIYYASLTPTEARITIDRVTGVSPRRATSLYTTNGATLEITYSSDTFVHQSNLGLTWEEFLGKEFLGALVTEQGVESATWDAFKPDPLGVQGVSGVFQLDSDIYAVRDFWGGMFTDGSAAPAYGDIVEVVNVDTFSASVGGYTLTSGSWEAGDATGYLHLIPTAATTLDMSLVTAWDDNATITNTTTALTLGKCLVQTGAVKQYQNKGLLWKLPAASYQGGWEYVDTGFSISFGGGEIAPLATAAPLITTESLPYITETGLVDFVDPATEYPSTGTYSAWANLDRLTSTTAASYATSDVLSDNYSRVIELQTTDQIGGTARILGLEVQITAHQDVGVDVQINKVQLRNKRTGAVQFLSANRATLDTLATTPGAVYGYGAQLDTWELSNISQDDLNNGEYSVLVQFYNTSPSTTRTVSVDLVQFNVHYAATGQDVFFWNGTADASTGTLYGYQVFDGDWSTDDAEGWMTVYDITTPTEIEPGMEIRSAAGGTGSLIALVRTVEKNFLPSLAEMDTAGTIYQSRKASFSGNENAEAAYVTTGASSAFSLDATGKFSFIRLPVDRDKDKPAYVEIHRHHLMLATGSHFLVSSVGAPSNFNTYDGATTWNPKDKITGLAAAPDGTTMVACSDSLHVFTGSGATGQDSFALKILTDNSGARDYTLTNLLGNLFVDYAGLTTADASDKYGGFDLGRKASHVRPLFQKLLGTSTDDTAIGTRLIGAIPIRKKNQYRIYMSDGEILTATMSDAQTPLAFTRQNYTAYYEGEVRGYEATFAPTAIDSSILTNGAESIIIGTRLGHVMKVDPSYMDILSYANKNVVGGERRTRLQTWKPFKFLDITPLHGGNPAQGVAYKSAEVYMEYAGYAELQRLAKTDYARIPEVPVIGSASDSIGNRVSVGDYDIFPGTQEDVYFTWFLDDMTDGLSIRFSKFGGIGSSPLRLNSMLLHAEVRAPNKNRIHLARSYALTEGELPQDAIIAGITGEATADGLTGTVVMNANITGITGEATADGLTGTVSTVIVWTWDDNTFTMDEDVEGTHTWDGDN